jgi:hypothetical protein
MIPPLSQTPLVLNEDQIKEIAEELSIGMRCLVNRKTGELLFIPDEMNLMGIDMDPWQDEIDKFESDPDSYWAIEAPRSRDSYQFMADFAEALEGNNRLRVRLLDALEKKKPFAHFKWIIDGSGPYREEWFVYRDQRYMQWVRDRIRELRDTEGIS